MHEQMEDLKTHYQGKLHNIYQNNNILATVFVVETWYES